LDAKLYVERWLLALQAGAMAAGLEAHVRALDYKAGRRLAFQVRKGNESLEIRYQKRRTGTRMLAAATNAEIVGRVREVHLSVLSEHRRLMENGFRRFLRKSIRMLEALESTLYRDAGLMHRTLTMLREISGTAGAKPAAVVRRRQTAGGRYEIMPAAALSSGIAVRLLSVLDGRLVDLDELMAKKKLVKSTKGGRQQDSTSSSQTGWSDIADIGRELVLVAGELADLPVNRASPAMPAAPVAPSANVGPAELATDGGATAEGVMDAGGIMAEHVAEAGGATAEAVSGVGASAIEAAGSVGSAAIEAAGNVGAAATEILSQTGSVLSDASCAGIDCGGFDCIPG